MVFIDNETHEVTEKEVLYLGGNRSIKKEAEEYYGGGRKKLLECVNLGGSDVDLGIPKWMEVPENKEVNENV